MDHDPESINAIATDVLKVLPNKRFFEILDDQMCPDDPAQSRFHVKATYSISTTILTQLGFDPNEIADITGVFAFRGGHCDCEILFNVAEESRLKSEYWKARSAGPAPPESHPRHRAG